MSEKRELEEYQRKVMQRLKTLQPIFARASIGDFSKDVELYEEEDEFSETYYGVEIMLEVIRRQIAELTELNRELERRLGELENGRNR